MVILDAVIENFNVEKIFVGNLGIYKQPCQETYSFFCQDLLIDFLISRESLKFPISVAVSLMGGNSGSCSCL